MELKTFYGLSYRHRDTGDSVLEWFPDIVSAREREKTCPAEVESTTVYGEQAVILNGVSVYLLGKEITHSLSNHNMRQAALAKLTAEERRVLGV